MDDNEITVPLLEFDLTNLFAIMDAYALETESMYVNSILAKDCE